MNDDLFISKKALAEKLGIPSHTLNNWMARNLDRGFHYTVIGKTVFFHEERIYKWMKSHFDDDNAACINYPKTT